MIRVGRRPQERTGAARVVWTAIRLLGFGLLTACATAPTVPTDLDNPMPGGTSECVIQPGDVVNVKFLYWPELNEKQVARPDGKMTLQIVDDVQAAGLRPAELRQELERLYAKTLRDPKIIVIAQMEENRRVYVGGEVNIFRNTDGLVQIPLVARMTALDAIMQAGGFKKESAQLRNVVIIRVVEGKQYARTIDMRTAFKRGESDPFYLQTDDIVFVPRTKIDRVDQWVDQFMNKPVPTWLRANVGVTRVFND